MLALLNSAITTFGISLVFPTFDSVKSASKFKIVLLFIENKSDLKQSHNFFHNKHTSSHMLLYILLINCRIVLQVL